MYYINIKRVNQVTAVSGYVNIRRGRWRNHVAGARNYTSKFNLLVSSFLLLFFQTFCHSETSDVRWLRLWKIVFFPLSILFFLVFSPCFLSYPAIPHDPQYNNNNIITRSRLHPVFSVRSLPVCCRNLMICYDIILIKIITITIYTYLLYDALLR